MSKGNKFERDFASELSLWWSENSRDDLFYRTPGSGARATTRAKKDKITENAYGDISASTPDAMLLTQKVHFELKRGYNNDSLQDMLDKKSKSTYAAWVEKAIDSCKSTNVPYWCLVIRRDRRQTLILTDSNLHGLFFMGGHLFAGLMTVSINGYPKNVMFDTWDAIRENSRASEIKFYLERDKKEVNEYVKNNIDHELSEAPESNN